MNKYTLVIGSWDDFENREELITAYCQGDERANHYHIELPSDLPLPPEFASLQEVAHLMLHGMAFRNDWSTDGTLSTVICE